MTTAEGKANKGLKKGRYRRKGIQTQAERLQKGLERTFSIRKTFF